MMLVGLVAVAIMIGFAMYRAHAWRSTMRQIADRYGLSHTEGGIFRRASARGRIEGVTICVDTYSKQSGKSRQVYTRVVATADLPPDLVLRREGFNLFGALFKGEDLQIGDPDFDGRALVRGSSRAIRALLDIETRQIVLRGLARKIDTQDGEIKWTDTELASFNTLIDVIDLIVELGQKLSRPADDAALAHVVRTDDVAVAIEALRIMPVGAARDAIEAEVIASRADALVMVVADRGGRAGSGPAAAIGVLRVLENAHNPHPLRAEALTWLGQHTDATAIARTHLKWPVIALAALEVLKTAEPPVSLEILARLVPDGKVAVSALRAARRHGVAAETLMIEALALDDLATARAAADGLGLVGTPNAVMALRERTTGLFADGQLKSAALAAIELIQGRVGAIGGGLSVVQASAAGRLSEAE